MSSFKKIGSFLLGLIVLIFTLMYSTSLSGTKTVSKSESQANVVESVESGSVENNTLSLITEPDDGLSKITQAILNATHSVDMVMYDLEDTTIENDLVSDEARGVSVRVILNGGYYGVPDKVNKNEKAYEFLTKNGVSVEWSPANFALTHQKSIVVDNSTTYILTFNFTPQYYSTSRDFALVDRDQNDVSAIEQTFDSDWNNKNITAEAGDDLLWSPNSKDELLSIIENAQNSLLVYNEEMADSDITNALAQASKRGVSVEVVMTDSSEWHKSFQTLSDAGVSVKTYNPKASLYIHAKMILADDSLAFVGSQNFSETSLLKNRELGIVIRDPTIISSLSQTFQKDFENATNF